MLDPSLLSALAIFEVLYVIALIAWIVLEKRAPAATLAWILALVALPGVGFAVYFFLGPRKIKRHRLRRLRAANAALKPGKDALLLLPETNLPIARELVRVAQRTASARLSVATGAQIFTSGAATFDAIVAAIEAAQHHVHLLYYIYEPDETGARIREALIARARSGVKVRVLLDAVGSSRVRRRHRRFFGPLLEAGGEVAYFHPLGLSQLVGRLLNFRNHRKIVVCDGCVGFTGGVNVTDVENETISGERAWRDTHMRLEGPCVAWLQVVFLEDWAWATAKTPQDADCFPVTAPPDVAVARGAPVLILESGPDDDREAIRTAYFAAINGAHSRVLVTAAYFVPDEAMLLALRAAAMRGVDVRVLVPRASDSHTVTAAGRSYYEELIGAGVQVYEYRPRMLHAKTIVVDDSVCFVGTANLDNRSFRLNFEVTALVLDASIASELAEAFDVDLSSSRAVTKAMRANVRLGERLFEGAARLLSPVL